MFAWLAENLGTIVISAVLLAIVAAIVIYLIRQKKQGKSTCGAVPDFGTDTHCAGGGL